MASGFPKDFNPRAELKKQSEKYATLIYYGIPDHKRAEWDQPANEELSKLTADWMGRPLWEMWALGKIYQFYISQWALQQAERPQLAAVVRFVLRLSHLADAESNTADNIVYGLRTELAKAGLDEASIEAAAAAGKADMSKLHAATRKSPYDSGAFTIALAPLLAAVPDGGVNADEFFSHKEFGAALCKAVYNIKQPKKQENFARAIKPLLIGVGGYGLVTLAFEDQWGAAFALKRQSMSMIMEKKHADRALLELQIASEVTSPFILDCPYAYVDGKDLVLALRMLPGGDLAHYLKEAKEAAKKAKLPKDGLNAKTAQFYVASTILALEVLHSHGFVYRDLKDKNLLLDATGRARLCDFGLVHDMKTGPAKGKVGTKGFWAPEQLDKHAAYGPECDLWTLGVCAYHWSSGTIPFYNAEGEEKMNSLTAAAEYNKKEPHLLQSSKADEKGLFRPGLASFCDAVLQIDPKARLGGSTQGGFPALMKHEFFKGLDWNALALGTLKPPIVIPHGEINADLPKELKDQFGEWAKKDVPPEAEEAFKDWSRVNTAVLEENAVALLDTTPVFFADKAARSEYERDVEAGKKNALIKAGLWTQSIKPPDGPPRGGGGGGAPAGGGGGGCCEVM
jgi:serine/threonine protein kinase